MFEDNVTIFNKKYDESIRDDVFVRTYLKGVNIDLTKAVNVIKSGLEDANVGTLYIPEDVETNNKQFLRPKEYKRARVFNPLTVKDVHQKKVKEMDIVKVFALNKSEEVWTLQPGDIIVLGLIDYIIKNDDTITKLRNEYDDVYEITSVDTKLKGGLPHWEVGLKWYNSKENLN